MWRPAAGALVGVGSPAGEASGGSGGGPSTTIVRGSLPEISRTIHRSALGSGFLGLLAR